MIKLIIYEFHLVYFLAPSTTSTVKEVEQTRKQNYFWWTGVKFGNSSLQKKRD